MKNIFKNFGIRTDNHSKNLALSGTTQSLVKLAQAQPTNTGAVSGASVAQAMREKQQGPAVRKFEVPLGKEIRKPDVSVRIPPGIARPVSPSLPRAQPQPPKSPERAHILPIQPSRPLPRITGATTYKIVDPRDRLQDATGLTKAQYALPKAQQDAARLSNYVTGQKLANLGFNSGGITPTRKDAVGSLGMLESLRK